jgi:hypothetical protein
MFTQNRLVRSKSCDNLVVLSITDINRLSKSAEISPRKLSYKLSLLITNSMPISPLSNCNSKSPREDPKRDLLLNPCGPPTTYPITPPNTSPNTPLRISRIDSYERQHSRRRSSTLKKLLQLQDGRDPCDSADLSPVSATLSGSLKDTAHLLLTCD